jgi:hypothetical protein
VKRVRGERGDIVLGWLTKLAAVIGAVGLLGFDGISLGQARYQAADRATTAALAAAADYATSHDVQKAYDAAYATTIDGDTIETKTFSVSEDGTVRLRLHHTATTLLVEKVSPLRHWTDAVGKGKAGRPS